MRRTAGRALRRVLNDCEKNIAKEGSRRGFCAQCRRDAIVKNGAGFVKREGLRISASAVGIAPFRGAGTSQRRGLATVHDGICS